MVRVLITCLFLVLMVVVVLGARYGGGIDPGFDGSNFGNGGYGGGIDPGFNGAGFNQGGYGGRGGGGYRRNYGR